MPREAPAVQALKKTAPNKIRVMIISFFLIEKTMLLWDGIVAPGVERIASQHSPGGHCRTFYGTVFIDRLISIMRAGGIKAAGVFGQAA